MISQNDLVEIWSAVDRLSDLYLCILPWKELHGESTDSHLARRSSAFTLTELKTQGPGTGAIIDTPDPLDVLATSGLTSKLLQGGKRCYLSSSMTSVRPFTTLLVQDAFRRCVALASWRRMLPVHR